MGLRGVEQKDFIQWNTLWKLYQEFYQVSLKEELSTLTFERFLNKSEPMECFVFEDGEKIVGFVHFIFHRSTWSERDSCYLQDLFVSPNCRSKDIGKQLIEAVYAEAENKECAKVYWLTHESNSTARVLYDHVAENVGFIQYRKNL